MRSLGSSGNRAGRNRAFPSRTTSGDTAAWISKQLAWFDTAPRKIVGAIAGVAALTAVAALAAVPFVIFSWPRQQSSVQAKAVGDLKSSADEGGPKFASSSDRKWVADQRVCA